MRTGHRIFVGLLFLLLVGTSAGMLLTSTWFAPAVKQEKKKAGIGNGAPPVDLRPLQKAQEMAALATTGEEHPLAGEVQRLADQEVDLDFDTALRQAVENPPPPTPETTEILARISTAQSHVGAGQARVGQLKKQLAAAPENRQDALQQELDLTQAQFDLDSDELADAKEDLVRAGGDKQAVIQQMRDEHEAAAHQTDVALASAAAAASATPQNSNSTSLTARLREWTQLRTKNNLLQQAQSDTLAQGAALAKSHEDLEAEIKRESGTRSAVIAQGQGSKEFAPAALATLKRLSSDQKTLAAYDKRVQTDKELADAYARWMTLEQPRQKAALHLVLRSLWWIFTLGMIVVIVDFSIERYFDALPAERRQLRTLRNVIERSVQVAGVVIILLIIFGPPNQLATVIALAGAGLTVALKDFIVGFLGWFVLMGRNGIRLNDWVEINGVGGEVVEIGLLHTVLLETGNWADAGHPTGRRVSFVNSFAIEGHYFNFSTSGQWLWDELNLYIPPGEDPNPIADAIRKIVATETAENAKLAEAEWARVATTHGMHPISAAPSVSVRPTSTGIEVAVRYITHANERHEVRALLYSAAIEMLQQKKATHPAVTLAPPSTV